MSRGRERFVLAAGERAKRLRARMEEGEDLRDYAAAGKDPGTAWGDLVRPVLPLSPRRDCGREALGGGGRKEAGSGGSPLLGPSAGREGRQLPGRGGGEEAERICC